MPEASALGLVLGDAEESLGKADLPHIVQKWNRFILQQVHSVSRLFRGAFYTLKF